MAASKLNSFDRKILSVAVFFLLLFGYLLYDDHMLMTWVASHGARVAEVSQTREDVRLKYAQDFRWNNDFHGEVHTGDTIFTGPKSEATIKLEDGSVIKIEENTMIVFNTNTTDKKVQIILKQGHVRGDLANIKVENQTDQQAPAEETKVVVEEPRPVIRFPRSYMKKELHVDPDGTSQEDATVTVRWTFDKPKAQFEFQIASDNEFNQIEKTEVVGELSLQTPALTEGSHFVRVRESAADPSKARWSKVSQIEIAYIRPKQTLALTAPIYKSDRFQQYVNDQKPVLLEWKPVANAKSYVVQVSADPKMKDAKTFTTEPTNFSLKDLSIGVSYFWVAAIGAEKEIGPHGVIGEINTLVRPPKLAETADKRYWAKTGTEDCPPTDFINRWEKIPQVEKYQIEVSNTASFSNALKYEVPASETNVKIEKPGKYFWRVQPLAHDGTPLSGFSVASSFKYFFDHPLATPALIEPAENMTLFFQKKMDTPFFLTWKSSKDTRHYLIEIATDAAFKNTVLSTTSKTNKYLVTEALPMGDLFWRVRAINGEHVSDWSASRKMNIFAGRTAGGN